jgi:DNA-binding transcriptional LysR family regulator
MELRHLRYFVAIAEEGSFTRAAERLWVAQPGLSTQIRRLEDEVGVQLFERHARGVELTGAGEIFLERARAVLAAADTVSATGRDLERGVVGSIRLGLASGARWHGTPALLDRFAHEREQVDLTIVEGYAGTLWRDLRDRRLDAIVAAPTYASPDVKTLGLGSEPWVALIGTSHPLAGIGPLEAHALEDTRIALSGHRDGAGYDRAVTELLDDFGVSAELVRGVPAPALQYAVSSGDLVALTTAPAGLQRGVLARPLEPVREVPLQLMWRSEALSAALDEFVRIAAEPTAPAPRPAPRPLLAAAA